MATTHAAAGWRSVCRHLHASHVARGNAPAALPFSRRASANAEAIADGTMHGVPSEPVVPCVADEQHVGAEPHSEFDVFLARLKALGLSASGNPKFMYMNYKTHEHKQMYGASSKEVINATKRRAGHEYDANMAWHSRWRRLFRLYAKQRQASRAGVEVAPHVAGRGAPSASGCLVW